MYFSDSFHVTYSPGDDETSAPAKEIELTTTKRISDSEVDKENNHLLSQACYRKPGFFCIPRMKLYKASTPAL